jgi:hypothetical protein
MPDTPISRRRRRELSRYGGLEKEASASSFYPSHFNNLRNADVHEGSVRDPMQFAKQTMLSFCLFFLKEKKHLRLWKFTVVGAVFGLVAWKLFHFTLARSLSSLSPKIGVFCN